MILRVGHLYPEYLNIYADRGNIAVLTRRAEARGHELTVEPVTLETALVSGAHDLLYIGGGQDREQAMIAPDLAERAGAIRESVEGGAALLAVCGGYQLLGRGYRGRDGSWLEGVGLFPHETVAGDTRMIGDVLLESTLPEGRGRTIAGFENHAGRTVLDDGAEALGRVVAGYGNDGSSGSRDAGSVGRSGRTSTARCSRAILGSPTSCCHGPSPTAPAMSPSLSPRSETSSRPRRTPSPPSGLGGVAADPPEPYSAQRAPR